MSQRIQWVLACLALGLLVGGCSTSRGPESGAPDSGPRAPALPQSDYEARQKDRAVSLGRQGRLAEAALTWEILGVLRPDVEEYRDQWARVQRQIETAVAERLQRANQAQRRGELDVAAQGYLAVLALQPEHVQAADALRTIERERNRRSAQGRAARLAAAAPRAPSPAPAARPASGEAPPVNVPAAADRNDLEHAAMLTVQGDFDDAIQLLEKRLAAVRQDEVARSLLADAYFQKAEELAPRDKAEAIAALEKSVRLDPTHPLAGARLKQLKAAPGAVDTPAAPRADKPSSHPNKRKEDSNARL